MEVDRGIDEIRSHHQENTTSMHTNIPDHLAPIEAPKQTRTSIPPRNHRKRGRPRKESERDKDGFKPPVKDDLKLVTSGNVKPYHRRASGLRCVNPSRYTQLITRSRQVLTKPLATFCYGWSQL